MSSHRPTQLSFIPGLPKVAATPGPAYRSACPFRNASTASPLHSTGSSPKVPQRARSGSNPVPNVSAVIAKNSRSHSAVPSQAQSTSLHAESATSIALRSPPPVSLTRSSSQSELIGSLKPNSALESSSVHLVEKAEVKRHRGHKHTDESRRKISIANRGNIPWNKGRRHTEETKRKIAESTRRAMLRPEMREKLKTRAKGRKHSEETKLKIREKARKTRAAGINRSLSKRRPVPFEFSTEVVTDLNTRIQHQLEDSFEKAKESEKQKVLHEKRPMSPETRAKLSERIKEMWADPEYRAKVTSGIERRSRMLNNDKDRAQKKVSKSVQKVSQGSEAAKTTSPKRRARAKKQEPVIPSSGKQFGDNEDIFLDTDALEGWTKEDLGIIGSDVDGPVQLGSVGVPQQEDYAFGPGGVQQLAVPDASDELSNLESTDVGNVHVFGNLNVAPEFPSFDNDIPVESSRGQQMAEFHEEMEQTPVKEFGASLDTRDIDMSRLDITPGVSQAMDGSMSTGRNEVAVPPLDVLSGDYENVTADIGPSTWPESERISTLTSSPFNLAVSEDVLPQDNTPGLAPQKAAVTFADDDYRSFDLFDDCGASFEGPVKSGHGLDFGLPTRRRDDFTREEKRTMSYVDRKKEDPSL